MISTSIFSMAIHLPVPMLSFSAKYWRDFVMLTQKLVGNVVESKHSNKLKYLVPGSVAPLAMFLHCTVYDTAHLTAEIRLNLLLSSHNEDVCS